MTQTPPISAEQVEAAARAMCVEGGFDPDEIMANDGPRWRYYAPGAVAALNAAASIPASSRGVETDVVAWKDVLDFINARAEVLRTQMPRQVFWALLDDMSYKLRGERAIDPIAASPALPVQEQEDRDEDAQIIAIARLYGNYIDGHGWTGFGPSPEKIRAALVKP